MLIVKKFAQAPMLFAFCLEDCVFKINPKNKKIYVYKGKLKNPSKELWAAALKNNIRSVLNQ